MLYSIYMEALVELLKDINRRAAVEFLNSRPNPAHLRKVYAEGGESEKGAVVHCLMVAYCEFRAEQDEASDLPSVIIADSFEHALTVAA